MGCIYNDREGRCTMRDEEEDSTYKTDHVGWEENGICVCEDDPDPSYACQYFESEYGDEEE